MRRGQPTNIIGGFESLKNDYSAARSSRFRRKRTGIAYGGSHADYHVRSDADYLRMMELARDMDRNDCIVGQMLDRLVVNVLQSGFTVDPQTGDKKLDLDLWSRWEEWSTDPRQCDAAGEMDFAELSEHALRAPFVDGDICGLPLEEGSIQMMEAHRLRTPSNTTRPVVHGVLMDEQRRRLQYWFTKEDISPMQSVRLVGDITPIDAYDADGQPQVFHVVDPQRISQTRGVTAFAPIIDTLGMFEDINFAKLVQQQVVSSWAVIHNFTDEANPGVPPQKGPQDTETVSDGTTRTTEAIGPGMEYFGQRGETIAGFSPNVPNTEFFEHVKLLLTIVGINLKLPLVMLLLDAKETNFSGWRGAVDQARMEFRRVQQWLIKRWHRKVYRWKVRQWIADDPILRRAAMQLLSQHDADKTKPTIFSHRFNAPRWPYIQPLDDAKADALRIEKRLISPRRLSAERGDDYDDILRETVEDNTAAITAAIAAADAIKATTGRDIDWHELLYIAGTTPLAGKLLTEAGDSNTNQAQESFQ